MYGTWGHKTHTVVDLDYAQNWLKYRWDTARLVSTFVGLVADGRLDLALLITHVAPFSAAADLFDLLDRHPEQVVQAVIAFAEA